MNFLFSADEPDSLAAIRFFPAQFTLNSKVRRHRSAIRIAES
jgi:hypothetical protein